MTRVIVVRDEWASARQHVASFLAFVQPGLDFPRPNNMLILRDAPPYPHPPTPWKSVILLCGKCARKMKGGYGSKGKDTLRTVLKDAFRLTGHRRDVRIIETKCMGICPEKAVTALNAGHPDRILTIPRGTATDEAMARLMSEAER